MVQVFRGKWFIGVIVIGMLGYIFFIKPYYFDAGLSEFEREETNAIFDEIIESAVENQNSQETVSSVTLIEDDNTSEVLNPPEAQDVISEEDTRGALKQEVESKAQDAVGEDALQDQIYSHYFNAMEAIRIEAEQLLSQLINEAKFEYGNLTTSERKDILVTGKLASKYISRANELEKIVDGAVERLLSKMENELEINRLSTESVLSLQSKFENEKKERRELLLSKAVNYQN